MAKIKANKDAGLPPPETGYLSDEEANANGEKITVAKKGGGTEERFAIFTDKIDPQRLAIINGAIPGKTSGVKPDVINVRQPDGTNKVRYVYYQDPSTGDWTGLNGQTISREAGKDRYVKEMSPTKFKAGANTHAAEGKTGSKKQKIAGW